MKSENGQGHFLYDLRRWKHAFWLLLRINYKISMASPKEKKRYPCVRACA